MSEYNSKAWRTFRRNVPYPVRLFIGWVLVAPVLVAAIAGECFWRACVFFWRELRDEVGGFFRKARGRE